MHVISGSGNTWKNRVQHPVHTKRQEHVTIVLYIVLQENMASSMGQDDEVSAPKIIFKKGFFGSDHNIAFPCGRQRIVNSCNSSHLT